MKTKMEGGFGHISMYMYVKFSLNKKVFTINSHYTFLGKYFSLFFIEPQSTRRKKCVS